MMHNQPQRAVNIFPVPHITRKRHCSFPITDPLTRRLHTPRIARHQNHTRPTRGETLRNGFPDAHGSASNRHYSALKFHSALYPSLITEVK
jgi:hypothetical protein